MLDACWAYCDIPTMTGNYQHHVVIYWETVAEWETHKLLWKLLEVSDRALYMNQWDIKGSRYKLTGQIYMVLNFYKDIEFSIHMHFAAHYRTLALLKRRL